MNRHPHRRHLKMAGTIVDVNPQCWVVRLDSEDVMISTGPTLGPVGTRIVMHTTKALRFYIYMVPERVTREQRKRRALADRRERRGQ